MSPRALDLAGAPSVALVNGFDAFVTGEIPRLRQALVARYGVDVGSDATSAATLWAWEHWEQLSRNDRPIAYLYRVAQSSQRTTWAWRKRITTTFPSEAATTDRTAAVDLGLVLAKLPTNQRICVLLVHAHAWSYAEVAELLGMSVDAVTNHVHRGTTRLRKLLKEDQ
jgi:DNA-directed RNA polymerase specialized sigma24 family protein